MILNICELIEKLSPKPLWGYTISTLLPAIHKVAYKYSINLVQPIIISALTFSFSLKCP